MDQRLLDEIRADLESEKVTLERQLAENGATPDPEGGANVPVAEGFADSAQATAERAELLSLIEQQQSNYAAIVAAIARIDDGTYGKCERCGEEIPTERLQAIPTATLCVRCKEATR